MDRWSGKVALVTGAGSGIGAAICKLLINYGMKIVGADINPDRITDLANALEGKSGSLMAVKCDLAKDEDIYALFNTIKKTYGGVDICINNAGFSYNNNLLDGSPEEWRAMLDVNVVALCLCTKLAVASMRERAVDDGHIINICSNFGHVVPKEAGLHFYAGSKFAVRAITEGLRQELREAKSHIRVSEISPAIVQTEFAERMYKDKEKAKAIFSSLVPLQPEDVAASALHVISAPPHVEINDVFMASH